MSTHYIDLERQNNKSSPLVNYPPIKNQLKVSEFESEESIDELSGNKIIHFPIKGL